MKKPLSCLKLFLFPAVLFCLILNNPLLGRADQSQDERTVLINQQLNEFDSTQSHADGVSREFSNTTQPDTLKDSPNAQPEMPSPVDTRKRFVKTRVHNLDVGSEILYYRYQEPNPGAGIKNHGPMAGYYADYTYRPASGNFLNNPIANVYYLQERYAFSHNLEYEGSGIVKGKHDTADEIRGLVGKDCFIRTDIRVTPYTGFGFRYLFDRGDGQLSSTGYWGYDRKSHYYYLPLGADLAKEMPNNWEIDLNAEYDILIYGLQKSYLSDGDQFNGLNNANFTNPQNKGFGLRASIKLLKRGSLVDFYVEPYFRFWNIEQSDTKTGMDDGTMQTLVEPKNNTIEVGSKFGVQF